MKYAAINELISAYDIAGMAENYFAEYIEVKGDLLTYESVIVAATTEKKAVFVDAGMSGGASSKPMYKCVYNEWLDSDEVEVTKTVDIQEHARKEIYEKILNRKME
jgi:hypothetical protein